MPEALTPSTPRRGLTLTQQIFIGLFLGIVAGAIVDHYNPAYAIYFRPFSQLFLRLIKMVIAPLIFATLVAGIAGAGHFKVVGRMGLRAIIYFEIVTTLALIIEPIARRLTSWWPEWERACVAAAGAQTNGVSPWICRRGSGSSPAPPGCSRGN